MGHFWICLGLIFCITIFTFQQEITRLFTWGSRKSVHGKNARWLLFSLKFTFLS